ncbi:hypothetical protein [Campylobacter ureolyticus]|uniref:Uncharacterized protein n=1 Tax=Campylobacter ureolyticus TaxID=827 RepID=A0A9Q4PVS9_9BACT|nr:hypothetical protein [Campylobacter ureolyticus]MCZ6160676.1 hypothetical protein [Campylobacter ureolyticus]MCZ6164408.1 hypothetical protein [Campylobacter ureolyticus]MCZ6166262.1 hypothetical protein [Campylobacter ureolyticus]MCZ6168035.1 hypothetical protein [Campylobacter ureolyticus]
MRKFLFLLTASFLLSGWIIQFNIENKFLKYNDKYYMSQCYKECSFCEKYKINSDKIYTMNKENGSIYVLLNDGKFEKLVNTEEYIGYYQIFPIENCDDVWCKIYYPCSDIEYFVKKDEIIKW